MTFDKWEILFTADRATACLQNTCVFASNEVVRRITKGSFPYLNFDYLKALP
jgi:hypothetical protein